MPDTNAVRQRRHKLHQAGDHSLCGPRCPASAPAPGQVAVAVDRYLQATAVEDPDVEVTVALTRAAAAEVDKAATPGTVRALESLLRTFRHYNYLAENRP